MLFLQISNQPVKWHKYTMLILAFLGGCSASGPKFSEPAPFLNKEAIVYMYRPYVFFRGGETPTIFVNGEAKRQLKNGGFIFFHVDPGEHKIKLAKKTFFSLWSDKGVENVLNVVSNRRYFLRLDIDFDGFVPTGYSNSYPVGNGMTFYGSSRLVKIPENIAIEEMSDLNSSM